MVANGGEPDPPVIRIPSLRNDFSWSFLLRGSALLARAVVALTVARVVGLEEAGRYFVVLAVVGLVALVGRVGGDRLVLSESIREPAIARHAFQILVRRAVAVSLVLCCAGVLIAASAGTADRSMVFGLLSVVPMNAALLASSTVRGLGRLIPAIVVGELLVPLAQVALFFSAAGRSADDALAAFAAANVLAAVVGLLAVYRMTAPSADTVALGWRDAGALLITAVNGQVRQSFPALAAGAVGGLAAAGGMGAAFRIDRVLLFPVEASRFAVAPSLKSQGSQLDQRVERIAVQSARFAVLVQVPLLVAALLSPTTFLSVLGEDFGQAANWLRLMAVGSLANALTGPTFQVLLVSDQRNRLAVTSILASTVLLLTFGVLASSLSADAVAIAVAVAYVTAAAAEWWIIWTKLSGRVDVFAKQP